MAKSSSKPLPVRSTREWGRANARGRRSVQGSGSVRQHDALWEEGAIDHLQQVPAQIVRLTLTDEPEAQEHGMQVDQQDSPPSPGPLIRQDGEVLLEVGEGSVGSGLGYSNNS